jgi:hypothetical protein
MFLGNSNSKQSKVDSSSQRTRGREDKGQHGDW